MLFSNESANRMLICNLDRGEGTITPGMIPSIFAFGLWYDNELTASPGDLFAKIIMD